MCWIITIAQFRLKSGAIKYDPVPTTLDQCEAKNLNFILNSIAKNGNNTKQIEDFEVTPNPLVTTAFTSNRDFSIFEISFFWYKVLGGLIVWVVAIPLSYFWKRDKYEKINPKLFTPIVRKFIKFDTIEMEEMPLKSPILNGENNATIIMSNAKNGGIDKTQHQKQNGANGDV
ncbi:uncharacterized protein LOC119685483 [Teleopsis dalmanni]|nr:uncharacterized protein LOC119685483 [Teleopsis dalmanni]